MLELVRGFYITVVKAIFRGKFTVVKVVFTDDGGTLESGCRGKMRTQSSLIEV